VIEAGPEMRLQNVDCGDQKHDQCDKLTGMRSIGIVANGGQNKLDCPVLPHSIRKWMGFVQPDALYRSDESIGRRFNEFFCICGASSFPGQAGRKSDLNIMDQKSQYRCGNGENSVSDRKRFSVRLATCRNDRFARVRINASFDSLPKRNAYTAVSPPKVRANSRISTASGMSVGAHRAGGKSRKHPREDGTAKPKRDVARHPEKQSKPTRSTEDGRQIGPSDEQPRNTSSSIETNLESIAKITDTRLLQCSKQPLLNASTLDGIEIDSTPLPLNAYATMTVNCESDVNEMMRSDWH
jgi:hypothetical protein